MTDAEEAEANIFARELLIPRKILAKEIKKLSKGRYGFSAMDDDAVKGLAKKFEVPLAAMVDQIRVLQKEGV